MSTYFSNTINISSLPVAPEIIDGDYFLIKTSAGYQLLDYKDLPFAKVNTLGNVLIPGLLSAVNITASSSFSAASAYFDQLYVQGYKGDTLNGNFNTFIIREGLILTAYNTQSVYYNSLSSTVDTKITTLCATIPSVYYDSGTIDLVADSFAPIYSEIVVGNNVVPDTLIINPADITVKYLWNNSLETRYTGVDAESPLSAIPALFIYDNPTGTYVTGDRRPTFKLLFRPALRNSVTVSWSVIKSY